MNAVCLQVWTPIREEIVVATNKCCHDVGLRKQRLGYTTAGFVGTSHRLYGFGDCTC